MDTTNTMWRFKHSIECRVSRDFAWKFWTNVNNWAAVDPSVESIHLEGPFAAGAKGTTKLRGLEPVGWKLAEVLDGKSALIEVTMPGALLRSSWIFGDSANGGTWITQKVSLEGERAADYEEAMKGLEKGIPQGMRKLAEGMVRAAGNAAPTSRELNLRRSG